MKIRQLAIIFLVGTLSILVAKNVLGCNLLEHTDTDGVKYIYKVEEETIFSMPTWDGISDEIPLSFNKAVSIAVDWIAREKKGKDLELQSISLSRIQKEGIPDKWYYSIIVDSKYRDTNYSQASYLVVVLLDGKVVNPKINKRQEEGR